MIWLWLIGVAAAVALFVGLRPMPVNLLNYLIWRYLTAPQAERGNIHYRGAQIHFVAYGHGEPVLLLHGGLSNKLSWFSQLPWLVGAGRRVVLIDTRGHGKSTPGTAELSYRLFAEDALQVLDRLGIQRTDIIGWSDGGIIALVLGCEAPQRVKRIVAISANFHPLGVIPSATGEQEKPQAILSGKITAWLRSWWSGAGEGHGALATEIKRLWRTAPQFDHAELQAISAPALVIAGEHDKIDLAHSGELAQRVANGTLAVVPGAGHAAPVTHARQVNRLIASFLDIKPPPP
jgi:pimeloyl-ACP methyl ester carboxylesterase